MSLEITILNENGAKKKYLPSNCSTDVKYCLTKAESLCLSIKSLRSSHGDKKTGLTNYSSLAKSEEFSSFQIESSELAYYNIHLLNNEERKCFFINIYNAITIHGLTYCASSNLDGIGGAISSVLQIPDFWRRYCYRIAGYLFSLDDIEHGILRGNREHPTSHVVQFNEDDPRIGFTLSTFDARIHFALNCGAKSCPMVRVYSSKNLEDQLEMVTKSYISQEIQSEKPENGKVNIFLPQIFEWYKRDFASDGAGVLRCIRSYVEEGCPQAAVIDDILADAGDLTSRIKYSYDWSLHNQI